MQHLSCTSCIHMKKCCRGVQGGTGGCWHNQLKSLRWNETASVWARVWSLTWLSICAEGTLSFGWSNLPWSSSIQCSLGAIECLASQTTKLLTHYGCATAVGRLLQALMELFILELGMGNQPFAIDFVRHGSRGTGSWFKSLWEKVGLFGVELGKLQ